MEMNYRSWGDSKNQPIILLHALACHSGWWNELSTFLKKDYYLVAPDLRGHGKSQWMESYSFDDYATDIEELARMFKGPYTIVGHSMGGYVGLKVAARGIRPPSALLIADMKIDSPEEELAGLRKASRKSGRTYDSLQAAVENYKLMPPKHSAPLEWVNKVAEECFHEQKDGQWEERFDRRALAIEKVESLALAQQVSCPTWIVRAKESRVMPLEGARELARITNGNFHEIEGTYHHLPLEVPEAFADLIKDFMVHKGF